MSEMVWRGAKAICLQLPDVSPSDCVQTHERTGTYAGQPPCSPTNCTPARYARAALLAALDLSEAEQQQLFEDDADHDGRVHNESVRATLQKLKAFAQGEQS